MPLLSSLPPLLTLAYLRFWRRQHPRCARSAHACFIAEIAHDVWVWSVKRTCVHRVSARIYTSPQSLWFSQPHLMPVVFPRSPQCPLCLHGPPPRRCPGCLFFPRCLHCMHCLQCLPCPHCIGSLSGLPRVSGPSIVSSIFTVTHCQGIFIVRSVCGVCSVSSVHTAGNVYSVYCVCAVLPVDTLLRVSCADSVRTRYSVDGVRKVHSLKNIRNVCDLPAVSGLYSN